MKSSIATAYSQTDESYIEKYFPLVLFSMLCRAVPTSVLSVRLKSTMCLFISTFLWSCLCINSL